MLLNHETNGDYVDGKKVLVEPSSKHLRASLPMEYVTAVSRFSDINVLGSVTQILVLRELDRRLVVAKKCCFLQTHWQLLIEFLKPLQFLKSFCNGNVFGFHC